ncbi:MAG: O-antigen ligase family protein [Candidatus Omnitrophica bacterium]|nr:O-antigen ligase family protein [Candidatus Omnitrophota bacterium]
MSQTAVRLPASQPARLWPMCAVTLAIACTPEVVVGGLPLRVEDLLLPVWLAATFLRGELRGFWGPRLTPVVAAWAAAMGFSTWRGVMIGTVEPWLAFCHAGKTAEYLLLGWLVACALRSSRDVRLAVWAGIGSAVLAGTLFGVIADAVVPDTDGRHVIEAFVPGEGSNILGGYFMFQLLLLAGLSRHDAKERRGRLLLVAMAIPMGYALVSTASRSAVSGLLVGLLVLGAWTTRWWWVAVAGLVLAAPWYLPPDTRHLLQVGVGEMLGRTQGTLAMRWQEWQVDWQYILQRPWFGYGLSMRPPSQLTGQPGAVDNEYVKLWLEGGLVGLGLFVWFLAAVGRLMLRVYHHGRDPWLRALAAGCGAAFAGMLLQGLTATNFTAVRTAESFWLMAGLLVAAERQGP